MPQAILFARTAPHPEDDMPGITFTIVEEVGGILTINDEGTRAIIVATGARTGPWEVGSVKRAIAYGTLDDAHADGAWQAGDAAYLVGDALAVFLERNVTFEEDPVPGDELVAVQLKVGGTVVYSEDV